MDQFKSERYRSDGSNEVVYDSVMLGKLLQRVGVSDFAVSCPRCFRPEHLQKIISVRTPSVLSKFL